MTLRPTRARRLPTGVARAGALVVVLLVGAACSSGDDTGGEPVPTLLTAPAQPTSTSSTTSSTTTPAATGDAGTSTSARPSTVAPSSTTTSPAPGGADDPSGPGSTPTTAATTAPSNSSVAGTTPTPTTAPTSTTADIEPPPPSIASTVPIPTAAQPPDTTGGREVDFLLGPKSIAGLQFGASRTTVLERMRSLLGDPLRVDTLPACAGTALQWFNVSVIITDRGLAYYTVGMNFDDYQDRPIPNWHTAAGLTVGADRAALDAAYPLQITYGAPTGLFTPFTVSTGADAGLSGRLEGDVLHSVFAGTTTC